MGSVSAACHQHLTVPAQGAAKLLRSPGEKKTDEGILEETLAHNSNVKLIYTMAKRFHNEWLPGTGGHLDASLDVSALLSHDILCALHRTSSIAVLSFLAYRTSAMWPRSPVNSRALHPHRSHQSMFITGVSSDARSR